MDMGACSGAALREKHGLQSGLPSVFREVIDGDLVISACAAPSP